MTNIQTENAVVKDIVHVTGKVLPVGNGAVGKTSLAKMLLAYRPDKTDYSELIRSIKRTNNLEFEFLISKINQGKIQYSVVSQLLIPPGQKIYEEGKSGRTFDQVMEIYKFILTSVDVILLTYDISARESFLDLKYWLNALGGLYGPSTNFLMVGTHLDKSNAARQVQPSDIEKGQNQVQSYFNRKMPDWKGSCFSLEVSNFSGKNMEKLEFLISKSILWSRGYISGEEFIDSYKYLVYDDKIF
jgi:GTPase SAR1 family protein